MTPSELRRMLELAAKAHGGLLYVEDMDAWIHVDANGNRGAWWHPDKDDGDSRRLDVKLGITTSQGKRRDGIPVAYAETAIDRFIEPHGDDPCAATRLAVLRAAAAIGEAMP